MNWKVQQQTPDCEAPQIPKKNANLFQNLPLVSLYCLNHWMAVAGQMSFNIIYF